jgi:hypothetical protein
MLMENAEACDAPADVAVLVDRGSALPASVVLAWAISPGAIWQLAWKASLGGGSGQGWGTQHGRGDLQACLEIDVACRSMEHAGPSERALIKGRR